MSRAQDPMPESASEQERPSAGTASPPPPRPAAAQDADRDGPALDGGRSGVAARSGGASSWRSTVETIGSVVAPTTLVGALLYYFGWARTNELYTSFGVDASALGFSVNDYVLRSTDATYVPLGALGVLILLALWAHITIRSWTMGRRRRWAAEVIAPAAIAFGLVAFARGVLGVVHPLWDDFLVTPLCLAVGVALLGYGAQLRRKLRTPNAGDDRPADPSWFAPAHITLVVLLVVLSLFWATEVYAKAFGRGKAQEIASAVTSRPAVTVYSSSRLHIDSPVVKELDLGPAYAPYRFRYTGLRLLIRSGGKYFLLPSDWSPPNSVTVVLPDTDAVRLEFRPAGGDRS